MTNSVQQINASFTSIKKHIAKVRKLTLSILVLVIIATIAIIFGILMVGGILLPPEVIYGPRESLPERIGIGILFLVAFILLLASWIQSIKLVRLTTRIANDLQSLNAVLYSLSSTTTSVVPMINIVTTINNKINTIHGFALLVCIFLVLAPLIAIINYIIAKQCQRFGNDTSNIVILQKITNAI